MNMAAFLIWLPLSTLSIDDKTPLNWAVHTPVISTSVNGIFARKPDSHTLIVEPNMMYYGSSVLKLKDSRECIQIEPMDQVQKHTDATKDNVVVLMRESSQMNGLDRFDFIGIGKFEVMNSIESYCDILVEEITKDLFTEPDVFSEDEVIPIITAGDPINRIDVVFMGDGYTLGERDGFVKDVKRLTDDMFSGTTFAAVLPLLNIWAVFRPSKESGIGVGGKAKDTAFGLYRDGTELRGIYPSKASDARSACKLTGQYACDFPSIIANDAYYGGLGGEFVIGTRSETSGTIVLRHEMGHNFISVGEEYDGGQVYRGCNSATSAKSVSWKNWLTEPNNIVEQKGETVFQRYAWYDLSKGTYSINFESKGIFSRWMLQISSSGLDVCYYIKFRLLAH